MQQKSPTCLRGLVALAIILGLAYSLAAFGQEENDPVLEYYWEKARETFEVQTSALNTGSHKVRALTYYYRVSSNGKANRTDTLLADYYYSAGHFDSIVTIEGTANENTRPNFSIPDIFKTPYVTYFFPNDTGGRDLAIGFDADSTMPEKPDGLVVIDRYSFALRSLYTHFADTTGFRRLSRSFHFSVRDGLLFPDSVWEVAALPGVISREYYRRETGVLSITHQP